MKLYQNLTKFTKQIRKFTKYLQIVVNFCHFYKIHVSKISNDQHFHRNVMYERCGGVGGSGGPGAGSGGPGGEHLTSNTVF